jgi:hypothetical protein
MTKCRNAFDCCYHVCVKGPACNTLLVLWSGFACEVKVVLSHNVVSGIAESRCYCGCKEGTYSIVEDRLTAVNILVKHWHNRRKHLNKELKDQEALAAGKQR